MVEEAALVVQSVGDEQPICVSITLTAPIMREQMLQEGGKIQCSSNNQPYSKAFPRALLHKKDLILVIPCIII